MSTLSSVIELMNARFNAQAAEDLEAVFQLNIEDKGTFLNMTVKNNTFEVLEGEHEDPDVTIITDEDTLKGILSGEEDGMQAFMEGKVRAEGDIMLAPRLAMLFPSN